MEEQIKNVEQEVAPAVEETPVVEETKKVALNASVNPEDFDWEEQSTRIVKIGGGVDNALYDIQLFRVNLDLAQFLANNLHAAFFNICRQYIL